MDFTNKVIAFFDGAELKVIHCEQEIKNKLSVRTDRGKQFKIPPKNVALILDSMSYDTFASKHDSLLESINNNISEVDTDLLWEMLAEDIKEYSLQELCENYFGEAEPIVMCGLFCAVLNDTVHFKRKGIEFAPRSQEQVDEQLVMLKRKQEKEEFKQRITPWLEASLKLEKIDDIPESFSPFLNLLEVFLSNRKDNEASRTFASVLGDAPLKEAVYDLLMKCGVISEQADRYLILAGIGEQFSNRIQDEAEQLEVSEDFSGREDFSDLLTFSIDDESTMDIDDALSVETLDDGLRIYVHITDVSSQIKQNDALDDEALNRVTSIYLPERTVNMIPKVISEQVCSLVAGEKRAAMSFIVDFDSEYNQTDFKVVLSTVVVDAKLSYSGADKSLENGEEYSDELQLLLDLAKELQEERVSKGAAIFNRPELKISIQDGDPQVKIMERSSPSRFLVSEFMILANFIAARFSAHRDVPIIYRVQDKPENLPEIDPDVYDPILFEQAIKCMKRSRLSLHPQSHGGLGADFYTQLTSPIRRYTDLVMQRQLAAFLSGKELPYEAEKLMEVIAAAEAVNGEAKDVQRQAENYWLHLYIKNNLCDKELEATVISKAPGGYMVEIDEIVLKTKLATPNSLKNGSRIKLTISNVKPRRGSMKLTLLED
ncbi:MAG: ribonuclease catalytic domain-containing protein [Lentisphaeraceae bacterium]|nr:ribonuclease catalytic domain-containing protein [Lentisphaeraceae bacterium]